MDYERFKAIVAAYGAAERRWPEAERESAAAFARADARAGAVLAEGAAADRLLDSAAQEADSALSAARALKRFHTQQAVRSLASPRSRSFWALAASALFGFALGVGAGTTGAPASEPELVLTTAFEAPLDFSGEDVGG